MRAADKPLEVEINHSKENCYAVINNDAVIPLEGYFISGTHDGKTKISMVFEIENDEFYLSVAKDGKE